MLMGYKYPYIKMETSCIQLVTDFYTNDCQLANSPLWFLLCLFEIHNIFSPLLIIQGTISKHIYFLQ